MDNFKNLRIVAINKDGIFKYYLMKTYSRGSDTNYKIDSKHHFSGYVHILNNKNEIVYANKFENGNKLLPDLFDHEFDYLNPPSKRLEQDCNQVGTEQWKDWYQVFPDGTREYTHSQFLGLVFKEVCNLRYIPDVIGGGGGSGFYKSYGGSVPVYTDCYDSVHGCGYDVKDNGIEMVGPKPLAEYDSECNGLQNMWNMSQNYGSAGNEFAAVLTQDEAILIISEGGPVNTNIEGLYEYNGQTYYQYPADEGAPARTYQGQITSAGRYMIPISALIHTHPKCLDNGQDGVSNGQISEDDVIVADQFENINHYAIGCGKIAEYDNTGRTPTNVTSGTISETCNFIN